MEKKKSCHSAISWNKLITKMSKFTVYETLVKCQNWMLTERYDKKVEAVEKKNMKEEGSRIVGRKESRKQ